MLEDTVLWDCLTDGDERESFAAGGFAVAGHERAVALDWGSGYSSLFISPAKTRVYISGSTGTN